MRTLITFAPASSYLLASAPGSSIRASAPLLGEERFTSAIIAISDPANAAGTFRTVGALSALRGFEQVANVASLNLL